MSTQYSMTSWLAVYCRQAGKAKPAYPPGAVDLLHVCRMSKDFPAPCARQSGETSGHIETHRGEKEQSQQDCTDHLQTKNQQLALSCLTTSIASSTPSKAAAASEAGGHAARTPRRMPSAGFHSNWQRFWPDWNLQGVDQRSLPSIGLTFGQAFGCGFSLWRGCPPVTPALISCTCSVILNVSGSTAESPWFLADEHGGSRAANLPHSPITVNIPGSQSSGFPPLCLINDVEAVHGLVDLQLSARQRYNYDRA